MNWASLSASAAVCKPVRCKPTSMSTSTPIVLAAAERPPAECFGRGHRIDRNADGLVQCELGQSGRARLVDRRIGQQQVVAHAGHDLGLAHLGDGEPDRPRLHLHRAHAARFVRFGVWANPDAVLLAVLGQTGQILADNGPVDRQIRRRQVGVHSAVSSPGIGWASMLSYSLSQGDSLRERVGVRGTQRPTTSMPTRAISHRLRENPEFLPLPHLPDRHTLVSYKRLKRPYTPRQRGLFPWLLPPPTLPNWIPPRPESSRPPDGSSPTRVSRPPRCARSANSRNVNIAAINYHFGDKQRLYVEAVKRAHLWRVEQAPLPQWNADTPAETKLADFIHTMLRRLLATDASSWHTELIMRELSHPNSACEELVAESIRPMFLMLQSVLAELVPSRRVRGEAASDRLQHRRPVLVLSPGRSGRAAADRARRIRHVQRRPSRPPHHRTGRWRRWVCVPPSTSQEGRP